MFPESGYECVTCKTGLYSKQAKVREKCRCFNPQNRSIEYRFRCGNCNARHRSYKAALVCCTEFRVFGGWLAKQNRDGQLIRVYE